MNTNFVDSIVGAGLHKKCLAIYVYYLSPAKPYQFNLQYLCDHKNVIEGLIGLC